MSYLDSKSVENGPRRDVTVLLTMSKKMKFSLKISLLDVTYKIKNLYDCLSFWTYTLIAFGFVCSCVSCVLYFYGAKALSIKFFKDNSNICLIASNILNIGTLVCLNVLSLNTFRKMGIELGIATFNYALEEFDKHLKKILRPEIENAIVRIQKYFTLKQEILVLKSAVEILSILGENAERIMSIETDHIFRRKFFGETPWIACEGSTYETFIQQKTSSVVNSIIFSFISIITFIFNTLTLIISIYPFISYELLNYASKVEIRKDQIRTLQLVSFILQVFFYSIHCAYIAIQQNEKSLERNCFRILMENFSDVITSEFNYILQNSWRAAILTPGSKILGNLNQNGIDILLQTSSQLSRSDDERSAKRLINMDAKVNISSEKELLLPK